tara:strand:- start:1445 stop:2605 length:1161 start_codon:yes stop_codon:yes gene_type:complete
MKRKHQRHGGSQRHMEGVRFNSPFISGNERKYIDEVFESGHFSGNGPFTQRVQTWLEDFLDAPRVLLTHSCTAGLEMSAMLNGFGPGDEIIVPSFTFVTTASSMMRTGAKVVFCEVEPETMLIDINDVESKITDRTKAIVPVHYAGFSPDMEIISQVCKRHKITFIEDSAQGLGSSWNGRKLGTFAPLASISFHETKNIHSGLGGCLVVNDEGLIDEAEIIWERGTNRSAFFKGLVDKYSWQAVGSSFYPSELQSAFLLAQLESMESNLSQRMELWNEYERCFTSLEKSGVLRIIRPPSGCYHNAHMFAISLNSPEEADKTRIRLNENGIQAVIHYVPLHTSPMGIKMGYSPEDLPKTNLAAQCLLRLPLHLDMSINDIQRIASLF